MQYAFVIDHRKCIGCHACTVACKAENEVPLGDFRTWVKYVEKGTFPEVRRHFSVLRCNHCDAAPCVEICPVIALHKRPDAIVDLDRDLCIGCRSCMQACPYDALYLNADTGTAEKCHYCAHRTEIGLEPACVIVCPVHAIVSGDLSNENSEIATLKREQPTTQRKLEKGTKPRVWYVDALDEALVPGATAQPSMYLWADRRTPPPVIPGFEPPADLRTVLNTAHPPVWGWHIWSYLTTKNIAAGAMMVAPFLPLLHRNATIASGYVPEIIGLFFLTLTTFFLVHDLGRPERFLKIIFHPNTKSWLVKGAWILMAFGGLMSASLFLRWIGRGNEADLVRQATFPVAVFASGYTAFLFAQCRGRDLWLEKGLFVHLLLRAAWLGAGIAMLLPAATGTTAAETASLAKPAPFIFLIFALLNLLWVGIERFRSPESEDGKKAHSILFHDESITAVRVLMVLSGIFTFGIKLIGTTSAVCALLAAIASLFIYERAWIKAGQEVPLS